MLTDEQIIHVLRTRQPCPTYFVKNVLRDIQPELTTAALRRRLVKMEKAGIVARNITWSTSNVYWIAINKGSK